MRYCVHFIFYNEKVLLLKRKQTNPFYPGIWTPIIGKIKSEEIPLDAVVRETKEESNIIQKEPNFIKHCIFDGDEYWFYHSSTKKVQIILNHENEKFDFFELNKLPDNLWSFFKGVVEEI